VYPNVHPVFELKITENDHQVIYRDGDIMETAPFLERPATTKNGNPII
jgi:hypothetical protein